MAEIARHENRGRSREPPAIPTLYCPVCDFDEGTFDADVLECDRCGFKWKPKEWKETMVRRISDMQGEGELTPAQAKEARRMFQEGVPVKWLATYYGVPYAVMIEAVKGKSE